MLVAPDPPRLQEGGADGDVLARQRHQFVGVPDRMPNLPRQVPQQIERRFDQLARSVVCRVGDQEQQIDVAERRHLPAPGAAQPDQCHARRPRATGGQMGRR